VENIFNSVSAALALLFGLPLLSNAGTILFTDYLTSPLGFIAFVGPGQGSGGSCVIGMLHEERCDVLLTAPPGGHLPPTTVRVNVAEPNGIILSDFLTLDNSMVGPTQLSIGMNSDLPPPVQLCANLGGCQLTENGSIQTLFSINWLNSDSVVIATDTIQFQWVVPEPSTTLLLPAGLVLLIISSRRKWRTKHLGFWPF
jgi:hypothetical protein